MFTELLSSEDDYTFYEIAFNRTFKFRRPDAYGEWLAAKRARETGEHEDASSDHDDEAGGIKKNESLPGHAPEWELDPMRALLKKEQRNDAIQRMDEVGLTEAEKTALIMSEVFEFNLYSKNENEKTIAKHLGVTGRTVQNLISRARLKLSGKE